MQSVNIHDAKTRFSQLVEAVMRGEEIIIAKSGKPAARLVPFAAKEVRKFGVLKGKIKISRDFDEPLSSSILDEFENGA